MTPGDVHSKDDLARFIVELRSELGADEGRWENADLASYLEALAGWVGDMGGWFKNQGQPVPHDPSWSLVAQMLRAATLYE